MDRGGFSYVETAFLRVGRNGSRFGRAHHRAGSRNRHPTGRGGSVRSCRLGVDRCYVHRDPDWPYHTSMDLGFGAMVDRCNSIARRCSLLCVGDKHDALAERPAWSSDLNGNI